MDLTKAANNFGIETDKLAALRQNGSSPQDQKQQQLQALRLLLNTPFSYISYIIRLIHVTVEGGGVYSNYRLDV